MTHQCVSCGRFVPNSYVALNRWGDYGGGPLEDDTLCDACEGPAVGSAAHDAEMVDWVEQMQAKEAS